MLSWYLVLTFSCCFSSHLLSSEPIRSLNLDEGSMNAIEKLLEEEERNEISGSFSDTDRLNIIEKVFGENKEGDESINSFSDKESRSANDCPYGLQFVGVGYNLLRGNPDGGRSANGGIDPGILTTRRHLLNTPQANCPNLPPEVEYAPRSSCVTKNTTEIYYGTKSYQEKFSIDVKAGLSGSYGLAKFAFSLSAGYSEAEDSTIKSRNVVKDLHEVCNRGRMRYKTELVQSKRYSVGDGFAADVCNLPASYSDDHSPYMTFIEKWGTHTLIQIELGSKKIVRSKTKLTEVFKYAMMNASGSVSASGSYAGFSGSLSLDINKLRSSSSFDSTEMDSWYELSLGSDKPEPIGFKLQAIPELLNVIYWKRLVEMQFRRICTSWDMITSVNHLATRKANLIQALKDYPKHLKAKESQDQTLQIPIVWPAGTYSLIQHPSGCPSHFHEGHRFQFVMAIPSTPFGYANSLIGAAYHWHFCTKTIEHVSEYDLDWPAGEYCILRKKEACPRGFKEGSLRWNEWELIGANNASGVLPDGEYGRNTLIEFCCREDGFAVNPIYLPTDTPFAMFKKNERHCQKVHGMRTQEAPVLLLNKDNSVPSRIGSYPYSYYEPCFCYYLK